MSAVAISGEYIYLALQDGLAQPVVIRTTTGDPATFETVYNPLSGTAVNVKAAASDYVFFYGDFGTDIKIIRHTVADLTNEDISPASLGAAVVNALDVNPTNDNEIWCVVNTAQDLLRTINGGTAWTTKNSSLGLNATGLKVLWPNPDKILIVGNTGSQTRLIYSSNQGTSFSDVSGSSLHTAANISALGVVLIDGSVL